MRDPERRRERFPAPAHAERSTWGPPCTYLTADAPDNDALACVARAVSVALSEGTTDDATINTAI